MTRSIFISHRHDDKAIAEALSREMVKWGVKRDWIFQSTHGGGGPRQGRSLRDELVKALVDARLVVLIYTFNTHNWNYCMYECGVAVDPKTGISEKRNIILQCTDDVPRVFGDRVLVDVRKQSDVLSLTKTFHQEPRLFLKKGAFNPSIDKEGIRERGAVLYEKLGEVIPQTRFEDIPRWGHFTLRLEQETLEKLEKVPDRENLKSMPNLSGDIKVTGGTGSALKHFGFEQHEEGTTLEVLVRRWSALTVDKSAPGMDVKRACDDQWARDLLAEIWRAADNIPSEPKWRPLLSVADNRWVCPLIREARRHPDGSVALDFTVYRVPEKLAE